MSVIWDNAVWAARFIGLRGITLAYRGTAHSFQDRNLRLRQDVGVVAVRALP